MKGNNQEDLDFNHQCEDSLLLNKDELQPTEAYINTDNQEDPYAPFESTDKSLSQNSRNGFIKKVYGILFCQLFLTWTFVTMVCFIPDLKETMAEKIWIFWTMIPVILIPMYALLCVPGLAEKVPINYIL